MNKEEIEEIETLEIDFEDTDELEMNNYKNKIRFVKNYY